MTNAGRETTMNQMPYEKREDARAAYARVQEKLEDASEELGRLDEKILGFARTQPLVAAAGALAVGFVVGRFVSRRF